MISRLALAAAVASALVATPAFAVGKGRDVSWGRTGISFEQYRADTLECGNRAYGAEVEVPPYGPLDMGAGVLPGAVWIRLAPREIPIYTTTYVEGYRHHAWWHTVDQLQAEVDSCLLEKGYSRFRLTSAQMRTLRRLEKGSPERHQYLYSLGSDANVLAAQGIGERRRRRPSIAAR
jgi:hypothetical protein